MLRRLFVILLFPVLVGVGVLLQSVVLVMLFLLAEMAGMESILTPITYAFFVLALIVSLYGAWRVSRRMWP